ncbi:MAG: RCC1 repeat-containing protein [Actinomycetota bacterium]
MPKPAGSRHPFHFHHTAGHPPARSRGVGSTLRTLVTLVTIVLVLVAGPILTPVAAAAEPGTPMAWGANPFGQLGDGTTTSHRSPAPVALDGAIDIGGGREHAVALLPEGSVYTWGRNNDGQIGDGTLTSRPTPTLVAGITDVVDVATGHYHTLAVRSDGTLWGWGYNALGQLCDGTTTNRRIPVRVGGLTEVTATAGGRSMTYALRSDGTLWACGDNANGQLGDGTLTRRLSPVRVGSLTDVVAFAGGRDHGLAVRGDGTVWSWGDNAYGQLGDGSTTDRRSPVQVPGISGAVDVSAGAHHSLVLLADGSVFAWGRNNLAQLGDGTTTQRRTPVSVSGLAGVVAIGAGRDHSLAVMMDGSVRAWGRNDFGQLGDGTTVNRTSPVPVPGLSDVDAVHGGQNYSVALVGTGDPGEPDVTPPGAPGTPGATSTTPGVVDLTWSAATDDMSTVLTYHVLRDGSEVGITTTGAATVPFSDTGLTPGSTHVYAVYAEDEASNDGPVSADSAPVTVASGPTAILTDDFSGGSLAGWSGVTRWTIDANTGSPSAPSARVSVSNQTSSMIRSFGGSYAGVCVSARVNVSSRSSGVALWRMRTATGASVIRVLITSSGIWGLRSDVSGATVHSTTSVGTGWHLLELCGTVGSADPWTLYRDGAVIIDGWVANTGATGIGQLELGNPNAGTWTANVDDVRVDQTMG